MVKPVVEIKSEAEDPEVPDKPIKYLSTILKDNEDITIIIHLLNNKIMYCSANYNNGRIRITKCNSIPSLIGLYFYSPNKLRNGLIKLLDNTSYKPIPKQNMWAQMFVERNNKKVSIASLK